MRGCQKRIVFLKNTGSHLFDEAYFILKSDGQEQKNDKNVTRDMVCEANRIIEENFELGKKRRIPRVCLYAISFVFGALTALIIAIPLLI